MKTKLLFTLLLSSFICIYSLAQDDPKWDDTKSKDWPAECKVVKIKSTLDGEKQPAYFYKSQSETPRPLIISLHTWSGGYEQKDSLSWQCIEKDFNYIHPHFRGPNWTFDACGSPKAIQDIEDAISWAIKKGNVDTNEIHVIGTSGGGYATLYTYMNTKHKIKTFSAWVPISNLCEWYLESVGRGNKYAKEIAMATTGKEFGKDDHYIDEEQAKQRSPFFMETPVEQRKDCKLYIFAGIHDGYTGSVPISQSMKMYNKLVYDFDSTSVESMISKDEMILLLARRNYNTSTHFAKTKLGDIHFIRNYNEMIYITIFEGGHQMLIKEAISHIK